MRIRANVTVLNLEAGEVEDVDPADQAVLSALQNGLIEEVPESTPVTLPFLPNLFHPGAPVDAAVAEVVQEVTDAEEASAGAADASEDPAGVFTAPAI